MRSALLIALVLGAAALHAGDAFVPGPPITLAAAPKRLLWLDQQRLIVLGGQAQVIGAADATSQGAAVLAGLRQNEAACAHAGSNRLWASEGSRIRVADLPTGNELPALEGHTATVSALACTPDGRTLISGGQDGTVRFWDAASGKPRATWRSPAHPQARPGDVGFVNHLAVNARGDLVAVGCDDHRVHVVQVATATARAASQPLPRRACCAAWSADGATLLLGDMGTNVRVWRPPGAETAGPSDPGGASEDVVLLAVLDARRALSADRTGRLALWELVGGKVLATVAFERYGPAPALSPDQSRLAVWHQRALRIHAIGR